jgi:IS5 family transposase
MRPRRPDDLAVPGETHQGRRHRAIVRALRCNASAIRFHRHGGPDRRCAPDRRSSSAQHPGREEGDQGRAHPRRLERQAREAPPEGSRRALDSQIHPNTPRPSRASKPREDGSTPPVDLAIPVFGYQNHISLDRGFGFIRKGSATDAAAYEGRRLRDGLLDKTNTARSVWADTAYRSAANEEFMERNGFVSHVHRKRPKGRPMPEAIRRANNAKSKIRSRVEHVFAEQKDRMGLFIRTIGIARAKTKIGLANLVYNIKRLLFLRRIAAA